MLFISAQIIGVIVLIITVTSIQFKTKEKILICQIIANAVVAVINVIRCIIFYYYKKKNKKPSIIFLTIFIVVAIASGILTWQNGFSIIPIIATIVFTYGLWQDNVKITRICTAITAGNWTIYNVIVKAYAGALQSVAECSSAIIAMWRNKEKTKEQEN